jgi:2-iminobutanoate/2-iminopropanoate deaminase
MEAVKDVIRTDRAPDNIGPFSQAVRANGFLFVSGQIPMDPRTRELSRGDLAEQAELVLRNLQAVLEAGGSSLDRVVRVGVFLKDMDEFARFNEVYARFFPSPAPARTTVEAARLPKEILVEIDAIALV